MTNGALTPLTPYVSYAAMRRPGRRSPAPTGLVRGRLNHADGKLRLRLAYLHIGEMYWCQARLRASPSGLRRTGRVAASIFAVGFVVTSRRVRPVGPGGIVAASREKIMQQATVVVGVEAVEPSGGR